ncbi:hypothetical protein ACODT5_15385 [Streptomyces sp. 5.8]|uniref:hypothetical protein n=1 Tax=Streptomyces sp. 5.8 TaxID=3406571 RepID=UPI003BB7240A
MNTQLTEQAPAINALAALVEAHGHLPLPFISLYSSLGVVSLQLDTPAEFEAWRCALDIPPSVVTLHAYAGSTWLAATSLFLGVKLQLSGHGLPVTVEQVAAFEALAVAA